MNLTVSPEARRWLQDRGGNMTLRRSLRHGCCGGGAGVPVAEPGVPSDPSRYRRQTLAGLDVYLAPDLDAVADLHVRLEGFLGWRRLFVDGADLAPRKE